MHDSGVHNNYECLNNISDSVIIVNDRWEVEFLNRHAQKEYASSAYLKSFFDQLRANSDIQSFFSISHHSDSDFVEATVQIENPLSSVGVSVSIINNYFCLHIKSTKASIALEQSPTHLLDKLPVAVLIVDKQFHVRYSNASANRLLNIAVSDLGSHCRESFCNAPKAECPYSTGNFSSVSENSILSQNGDSVPTKRHTSPITFQGEEMLLEVFIDATDKRDVQNELDAEKTSLKEHIENQNLLIHLSVLFKDFGNMNTHFDDFLRIIGLSFKLVKARLLFKIEDRAEEYSWVADGVEDGSVNISIPEEEKRFFIYDANYLRNDDSATEHIGKSYISFEILNGQLVSGTLQIEKNEPQWACSEVLFFQSLQRLLENVFELVGVHVKLLETKELSDIAINVNLLIKEK